MGISPDEDLASYVHVAHGLEVSSHTNKYNLSLRQLLIELAEALLFFG
jgi:hypothetical protein